MTRGRPTPAAVSSRRADELRPVSGPARRVGATFTAPIGVAAGASAGARLATSR